MDISTLTPIKQLSKPEEVSQLRSPRDSSAIWSSWKREELIVESLNKVMQVVNQLSREVKRIGDRKTLDFDFFPFKIYNLPDEFQTGSFGQNWLTMNIRGGYVFTATENTASVFVNGTDRMEAVSYLSILQNPLNTGQYTVPTASSQYWFWVETSGSSVSGSPYFVRASNTPQTPDNAFNPNGWTNWPSASAGNYLIGYVDTVTSGANNRALIRQIQVGDILSEALPSFTASVCDSNTGLSSVWTIFGYPGTGSL